MQRFVTDYLIGAALVVNIAVFLKLGEAMQGWFSYRLELFKVLAGFSFALYLLHRPMTQWVGYLWPNFNSVLQSVAMALLVLAACYLLSYATERRLADWRVFFDF